MAERTNRWHHLWAYWRRPLQWRLLVTVSLVVIGALCITGLTLHSDRGLRQDLLKQAHLVASAVDSQQIQALTGSIADLDTSEYQWLKQQLSEIRSANSAYRFIYLMGRTAEGSVFFYVDSEPAGSEDESPPGQQYTEASARVLQAFATALPITEGPETDRWGTWLTALVPLTDPQTGQVIAVLGIDIDAHDWCWMVTARAALPVTLLLLLLIGVLTVVFATGRIAMQPKPVVRHVLPPVMILLIALLGGVYTVFIVIQTQQLRANALYVKHQAVDDLQQLLTQQTQALAALHLPLQHHPDLISALQAGDCQRLSELLDPLYEALNARYGVTHFYITDPQRVTLLSACGSNQSVERFEHFTALEAERNGAIASGIELGVLGTFTLRVVQPLFDDDTLIGYLELGKEIEDIFEVIVNTGIELVVAIDKTRLDRNRWQAGMARLGREADWERFANHALIYASIPLPPQTTDLLGAESDALEHTAMTLRFADTDWQVLRQPIQVAAGYSVGSLLLFHDITALKAAQHRQITLAGAGGVTLLAAILALMFVLLRRTDADIRAQQAKLRQSEEQLNLFFSQSLSGFFFMMMDEPIGWNDTVDKSAALDYIMTHQRMTRVNSALLEQYGAREADFIGLTPTDLFAHDLDHGRAIWRVLLDQGRWHLETQERRLDGTPIIIEGDYICLYDDQGRFIGHFGVQTDITERKHAEAELIAAKQAAEAANNAKSRFLAMMSHELRTPMNGVLGMAQLLLSDPPSAAQTQDYARTILHSGQTLLRLLNDILDFSKIEAGQLSLEVGSVVPATILHNTQTLFAQTAREQGVQLSSHWAGPADAHYQGDPQRLQQMLNNLVNNALKFTQHGAVRITAHVVDSKRDKDCLEYAVSDTGIGIQPEHLSLLFKPFSQVDDSSTRRFGGTGLGLSIVRSLAEAMDGEVGVDSTPGKGSRFWFRVLLPRLAASAPSHTTLSGAPPTAQRPRQGAQILLVEDHIINQKIIENQLNILGLNVWIAANGQLGVERFIAEADQIDAVLMDVQMPVLDGHAATAQIRAWEQAHHRSPTPIIALTADAFAEDRQRCLHAGMDAYLAKPVDFQVLTATLAQYVPSADSVECAPAQATTATQPVDWAAFKSEVQTLLPLLAQSKFDALERFAQIQSQFADTDLAVELATLRTHLDAFRFAQVREALERMMAND